MRDFWLQYCKVLFNDHIEWRHNFGVFIVFIVPVSKSYYTRLKSEGDEILVCLKYLDFIINRDNLQ